MNTMQTDKKPATDKQKLGKILLRNGNPQGNPMNAPRCGAKTRKGTPCMAPAVRGKKRCRMHGGNNPGRPPKNPLLNFVKVQRKFVADNCQDCEFFNNKCFKVVFGKYSEKKFESLVEKYCLLVKSFFKK